MCGIGLVLTPSHSSPSLPSDHTHATNVCSKFDLELQRRLRQRGPDHYERVIRHVALAPNEPNPIVRGCTIAMLSAVLHLRGDKLIRQPISDANNNILCWNGEVFEMDGIRSDDKWHLMHKSDTLFLLEKLQAAGEKLPKRAKNTNDPVVDVLQGVRGPFAVTWFHEKSKRLYFAHDRFGRRSLLYRVDKVDTEEKNPVDILATLAKSAITSTRFSLSDLTRFVLSNVAIKDSDGDLSPYYEVPACGVYVLDLGAYEVVKDDELPSCQMEFYPYAPINPTLSVTSDPSGYVLDTFGTHFVAPTMTIEAEFVARDPLESIDALQSSARALLKALSNAVGVRIRSLPSRSLTDKTPWAAQVAVLFSGGLDSVVLAALSHFHTRKDEPIDLLTVCFDETSGFASPDRCAAEVAHAELCALYPDRQWNLIKINVPRVELLRAQEEVQTLITPCNTHMDFNIGAAFWFLSRGDGVMSSSPSHRVPSVVDESDGPFCPEDSMATRVSSLTGPAPSLYTTRASVVFVGSGADEQLAGYKRHYTTLLTQGPAGLRAELEMDVARLWTRNLGRDDRCLGAHGREARFPYLDEHVVATIATFPISSLCAAHLPRGVGDKRALRLVAKTLGLTSCAQLPKRAIQFGSRIAKVSSRRGTRQRVGKTPFRGME